ncbi:MAG: 6-carboxytetrahydropterin synthase [Bacteroidales bacterium]|nr:6-carboxytetrahydropterin synthase [Bacteroidales bacterium]
MKLRLTKEFSFDMAHALTGYDGKCRNIHGHTYHLFVTVEGEPLDDQASPKDGMVVDFNQLKQIVNDKIVEPFDHALVLSRTTPLPTDMDTKLIITDWQPTSENLIIHFSKILLTEFPENVRLHSLKLYETETSCAELIL